MIKQIFDSFEIFSVHRKKPPHVCGKTFFPSVIHVATNKNNPEMPLPSLPAATPTVGQEAEGEKTPRNSSSSGFGGESKNSDSAQTVDQHTHTRQGIGIRKVGLG